VTRYWCRVCGRVIVMSDKRELAVCDGCLKDQRPSP